MIRSLSGNRWVLLSVRLALGGLLIASSAAKLANMQLFADAVAGYHILPGALASPFASALPWAELFVGCCLVLGAFIVPAAALSVIMSVSFVVANSYALSHSVGKACSCLGALVTMSHPVSLGVDLTMIAAATMLVVRHNRHTLLTLATVVRDDRLGLKARDRVLLQSALVGLAMITVAAPIKSAPGFVDTQIDEALRAGQTAVVFFWTGDPSEPALYDRFQILAGLESEYGASIRVIRVEFSQDPPAVSRFGIRESPTMLVMKGTGSNNRLTIVGRLEGDFERWQVEDSLNGESSA